MTGRRKPRGEPAFADPSVAAAFAASPPAIRARLLALRRLILDTAANTEGVGPLHETLKWGQPSYLTAQSKSGSTVRIGQDVSDSAGCALFFHCQTDLVETFRRIYPTELRFGGNRSILLAVDDALPEAALRHCVALALTYHQRKRRSASAS